MNPYWRAAASSYTGKRVLLTQGLGFVLGLLTALDEGFFGQEIGHESLHFAAICIYVLVLLPVAACAEERVTRGGRPVVVYTILLTLVNPLLAAVIYGAVQWLYCLYFAIPWPANTWAFTTGSGNFCAVSTLALLVYMNRRAADRMLEGVRGAELRRVQLDQQLVDSRLATAEAQIDPQMLFGALADIKHGFEHSAPDADKKLNELIQTLRTALARTTAVSSAREI